MAADLTAGEWLLLGVALGQLSAWVAVLGLAVRADRRRAARRASPCQ